MLTPPIKGGQVAAFCSTIAPAYDIPISIHRYIIEYMAEETSKPPRQNNILNVKKSEQYDTVEELFKKSQPNSIYYTLLFLSSLIVAAGLLLGNSTIVIGGMLVTPLLTPILIIALGIAVGELGAIKSSAILVLKSLFIVIAVSFGLALLLGSDEGNVLLFGNALNYAVLYFIVAFASGVAATFAWVRKEVADILPGIAVAVSIVPPLGVIGIGLSALNPEVLRLSILIFIFNFLGVILGSLVVFSLLKFHKSAKAVHEEITAAAKEESKAAKT